MREVMVGELVFEPLLKLPEALRKTFTPSRWLAPLG
jgi:hypothetical protein